MLIHEHIKAGNLEVDPVFGHALIATCLSAIQMQEEWSQKCLTMRN